jgi:AraC-like DNA-binding protein
MCYTVSYNFRNGQIIVQNGHSLKEELPLKLELRTNLSSEERILPFTVYTVGMEQQPPISRLEGFSAHQLLITASGSGRVHLLGQNKWDIMTKNSVLYIPAGFPNEYAPINDGNWLVGFVSFHGSSAARASWELGDAPIMIPVRTITRLLELLERIWQLSGLDYDPWTTSELLFSMLTEWRKQSSGVMNPLPSLRMTPVSFRESTVLEAAKFLQDYMHREIKISQLAKQVGYSQKQLTRLFLHTFHMTPLQYLRHIRLKAAQNLLETNADLSVGQIARQVGMEPTYFTRAFRQTFGIVPSEYRSVKASESADTAN